MPEIKAMSEEQRALPNTWTLHDFVEAIDHMLSRFAVINAHFMPQVCL
jgi:hypothetical protein